MLRVHEAADGLLARVRLPGGLLSAPQLTLLADASREIGDGRLELTSRGNVQVRGMDAAGAERLGERLSGAGLLPSAEHERARNIVASPLAGIDRVGDLTGIVRALDAALVDAAPLASLSGRFLFAIDDGRGDVAALRPDLLAVVPSGGAFGAWVEGVRCRADEVPQLLVRAASMFVAERDRVGADAWHVDDLPGVRTAIRADLGSLDPARPGPVRGDAPRLGAVRRQDGGAALVLAPLLGRLTGDQSYWLAARSSEVRMTPWRSVVVPSAPSDDPGAVGLLTDPSSRWAKVSACAGRPRCASALADVQADARADVVARWAGRRVHWSGCERRCGRTPDVEVDVVATSDGYRIEHPR